MIKNIGIIGAGSVGSALISRIMDNDSDGVYLVASGERAQRLRDKGISVNNREYFTPVISSKEEGIKLDLIIVAVKAYSLPATMEDIAAVIDDDTIILPILNGINATELLRERFPHNKVFYGIVLRTDTHRMGRRVYFETLGELQLGYADNRVVAPEVQEVYDRLVALGINAHIYEDMRRTQWRKWMLNTGASQTAAEIQVPCGFFGQVEEIQQLMRMCMMEIVAIAEVEGVNVTEKDVDEIIEILINFPHDKKMSMLQDLEAGRPIEIEEYAGQVIELGKKHGIPTPINEVLFTTINARQKVIRMRQHMTY